MNVSGIVIKTLSDRVKDVLEKLGSSGLCEVHFHDEQGRIVATIEGADIDEEMRKLKLIQAMPHIVSANLAYAYSEQEVTDALEHITRAGKPVPNALNEIERAEALN